jgi:E3 ubiquitin-protein ligase DOA10
MKSCALVLSIALAVSLAGDARAQCQRGGGRATPTMSTSTGTAITTTIPLVSSSELAYQMMQRAYLQQAYEQEEAAAKDLENRRQQRISVWREHRQAELARREEAKARNLARRNSEPALAIK